MDFIIEVLTPVNIGSGEVLSQFSDYVYEDGYVYYLDHDMLLNELLKKPNSEEMIDKFVLIVKNQAKGNLKDRFKLKAFLDDAGLDYKKYSALRKKAVSDEIKEQIQLHIKSGGLPYIPGSSLKGAIRTALISFFFKDSEDIIKKKKYIGEDIFGSFGKDELKYLLVSDTAPFSEENLGIAKFYKFNIKSCKTDIPVIKEVISQGSVSIFTIKTKAKKGEVKEEFNFLQEGKEELLLGIINEYTKKNVEIELEQLRKCNSDEINEINGFYRRLLERIEKADSSKEVYLRMGSGKTYYDNTIAQKLSTKTLQKLITRNFARADYKNFPVTRTIIIEKNTKEVPGWVRITKRRV